MARQQHGQASASLLMQQFPTLWGKMTQCVGLDTAGPPPSDMGRGTQPSPQGPGSHRSMVLSLFRRRRASSFELLLSSCCCSRNFICFCREASICRPLGRLQGLLEKHPGLCALQAAGSIHWLLTLSPPQQPRITASLAPSPLHPKLCSLQAQQGLSANRIMSLALKRHHSHLAAESVWGLCSTLTTATVCFSKSKGVPSKQTLKLLSPPHTADPSALASQFSLLLAA